MARSPEQEAALFLGIYFADADSWEEAERNVLAAARSDPRSIRAGLAGLEAVLAAPQPAGLYTRLVGYDANRRLASSDDAAAAEWLRRVAELARRALAQGT